MIQQTDKGGSLVEKANAAFETVATKVVERAMATGTPVIIWRDGQCVSVSPEELQQSLLTAQAAQPTSETPIAQ